MTVVTPLRFVSAVIGLWILGRAIALTPNLMGTTAEADVAADRPAVAARADAALPVPRPPDERPAPRPTLAAARGIGVRRREGLRMARLERALPTADRGGVVQAGDVIAASAGQRPAGDPAPSPTGLVATPADPALAGVGRASRWSGYLYLYRRGDGDDALASGGQLGGSQAGGRIAYRLNAAGPARFSAAARLSAPLNDRRGAEAAAGLDWHPLPGRPLRVSIERRVDLGGAGRNAWSAYAAGGFWRQVRPGFVVDGYAQAGIVGARRGDLFADGALRAGRRQEFGGGGSLTIGGGVWGAAQPRVERIDIGPRAALGLPLAGAAATLAAEWRIRIAGDASPRSGLAITLAADF